LKTKAADRAAIQLEITTRSLIAEFEEIKAIAMRDGDLSSAISAAREKAILSGKRVERAETGLPGEFAALEAMNREQLLVVVTQLLEGDDVPALEGQGQLSGKSEYAV
jgi:hypothetical protein